MRTDCQTYHAQYGPINRFQRQRTGRTDPETGAEILRRVAPRAITAPRICDQFHPIAQ